MFFLFEAPCPRKEYVTSTLCGVAAGALLFLLLVVVVTYKLTKHFVQKNLQKSLSHQSDDLTDSCKVFYVFFFFIVCQRMPRLP